MKDYEEYPKFKYAADKDPVLVHSREEEDALDGEWFDKPDLTNHTHDMEAEFQTIQTAGPGYNYVEYPKVLYRKDGSSVTVETAEEEEALEGPFASNPGLAAKLGEDGDEAPKPKEKGKPKPEKAKASEGGDGSDLL